MLDCAEERDSSLSQQGGSLSYPSGVCFHVACPIGAQIPKVRCPRHPSPFWVCKGTTYGKVLDKAWGRDRPGKAWRGKVANDELGVQQGFPCGSQHWGSTGLALWRAAGSDRKGKPRARGWDKEAHTQQLHWCKYTGACSQLGSSHRSDKSVRCTRRSDPLPLLQRWRNENEKRRLVKKCSLAGQSIFKELVIFGFPFSFCILFSCFKYKDKVS